ncbi:MAG: hypothetical protein HKN35_15900 [Woeseia sp.]|nr:hypothetical protein [Woeseia sp.]
MSELNRQARVAERGYPQHWVDCGNVTHAAAAECLARLWHEDDGDGESQSTVETRDQGSDVVHRHRVTRRVVYEVVSLRGDLTPSPGSD